MDESKRQGAFLIGLSSVNEELCAAAGRISTGKGSALDIYDKSRDREKNASLIQKVTLSGHTSTLEHCVFNLAFSNVSVIVEQFMIEFRLASFTVQSRRYVDFTGTGYYIPDFSSDEITEAYKKHMDGLFDDYAFFTENGIPKEDARFVLPYCFRSNFFCTLNAREMINVLKSAIYGRGSKYSEIKEMGLSLLAQCREAAPGVFTDFEKRNSAVCDSIDLSFVEASDQSGDFEHTTLLSYTPNAEKEIAKAALLENRMFSVSQADKATENEETVSRILDEILKSSRPRALESALFTFRLSGVSLACLTHFARHRIHSLLIPDLNTCDRTKYVVPESIKADKALLERYVSCFEKTAELYKMMLDSGEDENKLIYVLLAGNTIDIVSTMNAREYFLFFKLRTCTRAQWEIQGFANEMLRELRKVCPVLFSKYGPSCYAMGKCPEGARFTCGRAAEIKEKYGKIN